MLILLGVRRNDPLEVQRSSGALLTLGPAGLSATVRGASFYCDWEHVAVHECGGGVIFVLARREYHLVPPEVLLAADPGVLRELLRRAGVRPAGGVLRMASAVIEGVAVAR